MEPPGAVLMARKVASQCDRGCASKAETTPYSSELDEPPSPLGALPTHPPPPPTPVDGAEGQGMERPEGAQPETPVSLQKPKSERSLLSSPPKKTVGMWRPVSHLCSLSLLLVFIAVHRAVLDVPQDPAGCILDAFFEFLFTSGLPQPSGRICVRLQSSLYFQVLILCLS